MGRPHGQYCAASWAVTGWAVTALMGSDAVPLRIGASYPFPYTPTVPGNTPTVPPRAGYGGDAQGLRRAC